MAISDWSSSAASNGNVLGIDIAENCAAANVNNALRETLAQIKAWYAVAQPLIATIANKQPLDATLTALAAVATGADKLAYFDGNDSAAVTTLTAFMRTLLDDADATSACNTLGAVRVAALSLANPGYVRFQVGAAPLYFQVAWGTFTANANGSTSANYVAAFPNGSWAVASGTGALSTGAQDNNLAVTSTSTTGLTVFSASDSAATAYYIACGY